MESGIDQAIVLALTDEEHLANAKSQSGTLLFLITEDWYFNLHRIPLADGARRMGLKVVVAARDNGNMHMLAARGFELVPLKWQRGHVNLLKLIIELLEVRRVYRRIRPDDIHHVAMKPSLIGSFAAVGLPIPVIMNNLAGLGSAFSRSGICSMLARMLLKRAFKYAFSRKRSVTIVENRDDLEYLVREVGISQERVRLIRGVGVNIRLFSPTPEPPGRLVVTMVSRMLWHKGVGDLVEAARLVKNQGLDVVVRLVGDTDEGNLAGVPQARLREWHAEGVVEWWGFREDIEAIWRHSHIAVFPSYYREGIPRSLLEAAACGRPIITTDMPGCREIVRNEVNGILVMPKDPSQLAAAITRLARDKACRERMGTAGRRIVEAEFGEDRVVAQTMDLYRRLMQVAAMASTGG
jgi:glycosyltransferase involved in cell wall biosynthesis